MVQLLLWEAARDDAAYRRGAAEVSPKPPEPFLFYRFVFLTATSARVGVSGAVTTGQITCIAKEMVLQRQASESSEAGSPVSS